MFCISTVLPVRGGATISARWPLPIGATMSITRAERSFLVFQFEPEALIGKQRRQIVEIDLVLGFLGVFKIQRVDLEQREIAFAFFRAANVAFDGVAGTKSEAADLRR